MALSPQEAQHVRALAEGKAPPETGMEKHFVQVLSGKARACSPKEREWLEYWQSTKGAELDELAENFQRKVGESTVRTDVLKRTTLTDKIRSEITEIEHRQDLSDEEKISRITHIACATCAGIAIQPIPFADIFILTPIQAYFGSRIASIRGIPVSESNASDLIKEIIAVIGMGFIAQQLAIAIWKLVTFGAGGLLTIPLVYALTFAVMKVIDAYYAAKAHKQTLTNQQMKAIWKQAFLDGRKKAKDAKSPSDIQE